MVLDSALFSTRHYKVRIKSKEKQSREWSCAFPQHLNIVAIQKGAFGSPSTTVANFAFTYLVFTRAPEYTFNSAREGRL